MKISSKQYAKLIDQCTENVVDEEKLNKQIALVLKLIRRNRDQAMFDKIIDEYDKLSQSKSGEILVQLESGTKLSEQQIERIKGKISQEKDVASDKIKLILTVDPRLIGGIRVKIENKIIDGSVESKLARLQLSLT